MAILLIGTLDTKGQEFHYLRELIESAGVETLLMDAGSGGEPTCPADISREQVFAAAGADWREVQARQDRGEAVTLAAAGARALTVNLYEAGRIEGVISLGGGGGTTIATSAMRALPFGVPKVMVSTLASGQVRPFVGPKDIVMWHSVTDISGINRISRRILANAARAIVGMVQSSIQVPIAQDKPLLAATMFGVTTPCVEAARSLVEAVGYETLVFHAVGTGGEAMESLVADGLVEGVLDLTTTELADELVGGVLSAGPDRLTAAARRGVPQVVSVGALDMVNFGPRATVPERFDGRKLYVHNENVTLMRTTPEENNQLGTLLGEKVSAATGPAAVLLPLRGVSAIDAEGKPFWDPSADHALFEALRRSVHPPALLVELDLHINDPAFAKAAVDQLLAWLPQNT